MDFATLFMFGALVKKERENIEAAILFRGHLADQPSYSSAFDPEPLLEASCR
jgi:hypothetical protein